MELEFFGMIVSCTLLETNSQFAPENRAPLEFRKFLLETTIFRGELLVLEGVVPDSLTWIAAAILPIHSR